MIRRRGKASVVARLGAILVVVAATLLSLSPNAFAGMSQLCTGFSGCSSAGYTNHNYAEHYTTSYWGQYAGHNCTNYAAYMLTLAGVSKPAGLHGDAKDWGDALSGWVDHTPTVGAIAWWDGSAGMGSDGHVAYVEVVKSGSDMITSEDAYGGDFRWREYTAGYLWPTGFIHFPFKPQFTKSSPPGGAKGAAYSYTFAAIGWPAPTFSKASGSLPPGLSLSSSGKLSGTPTAGGSYTFTVKASNSQGSATTPNRTVVITAAPQFTEADPPDGLAGTGYSYTFKASGYPAPTFALASGALPSGLSLSAGGVLAGTPVVGGEFTFAVKATNSSGSVTTPSLTMVVNAAPHFVAADPPDGEAGTSYSYDFVAEGMPVPIVTLKSGSLPDGLVLQSDGTLTGTPSVPATFTFDVEATNAVGSTETGDIDITITPVGVPPVFTQADPPDGDGDVAYSYVFAATGTPAPTFAVASGELPAGVTLAPGGTMAGTPAPGTYTFEVVATNSAGSAYSGDLTVTVNPDHVAPRVGVASPHPGEEVAPVFVVSGTAVDASGIGSIRLRIAASNTTWLQPDGSIGQNPATFAVTLGDPVGLVTNWTTTPISAPAGRYRLEVIASDTAGNDADPVLVVFTVLSSTVPGAPAAPSATSGLDSHVDLTWTAPDDGGAPITSYDVQRTDTYETRTTSATAFSWDGLTNGVTYSFRVRACNVVGCGDWSAAASATPYTVPSVPPSFQATSGLNGKVQLSWSVPADGGSPIVSYELQRTDTGELRSAESSPYDWTGLTNGTTYGFRIHACNAAGCGDWSAEVTGKPYTVPGTVGKPTASSQNNAIELSWSAPGSGGSAITRYEITGSYSGSTGGTSITIQFGQDGGQKTFQVRACNAAGCGGWSSASSAVRAKVIALSKGGAAPAGYWYDTRVYGVPGATMTLHCNDGGSQDWWQQSVTLDGTGYYRDSTLCYSSDLNPHWVNSGSLVSNKINF